MMKKHSTADATSASDEREGDRVGVIDRAGGGQTTEAKKLSADELRLFIDRTGSDVFELRIKCSILLGMIEDVFVLGNTKRNMDRVTVELSSEQFDAIVWLGGVATAAVRRIENSIDDLFWVAGHDGC